TEVRGDVAVRATEQSCDRSVRPIVFVLQSAAGGLAGAAPVRCASRCPPRGEKPERLGAGPNRAICIDLTLRSARSPSAGNRHSAGLLSPVQTWRVAIPHYSL